MRRLHDAYRYTTVYVTHDQSEAMTTADLICVMNDGKIEQAGTPEDIYDRPRSEFVARFIGSSNVIKGKGLDDARIDFAGVALRCVGAKLTAGSAHRGFDPPARHHDFRRRSRNRRTTSCRPPWCGRSFSAAAGTIWLKLKDGTQLRVVTAADESIPQGSAVWLHLPPERCRALLA